MTPNELLDDILNWFATHRNAYPGGTIESATVDHMERIGVSVEEQGFGNLKFNLIEKAINKLVDDKFIILNGTIYDPPEKYYTITFEGIVFSLNGGYVKREEKENSSKNLKDIQSWTIAIGAALAGLSVLYSFLRYISCNCY
jgi:hypothetical protein